MNNNNYNATLEVSNSANEAFNAINHVHNWWSENLEGSSEKLNDVFTIHFGGGTYVTHKLVEVIPDQKVIWHVTNCHLPWLNDKSEWNGTEMSFDISAKDDKTYQFHTYRLST